MLLFFDNDINAFFSDFAFDALLLSAGAGSKAIKVLFDKNGFSINPYTGETENSGPAAQAKTSDVEGAVHKDILERNGISYEILEIIHDDTGITTLRLNKT